MTVRDVKIKCNISEHYRGVYSSYYITYYNLSFSKYEFAVDSSHINANSNKKGYNNNHSFSKKNDCYGEIEFGYNTMFHGLKPFKKSGLEWWEDRRVLGYVKARVRNHPILIPEVTEIVGIPIIDGVIDFNYSRLI
jgi:hypothetical protein